MRNPGHPLALLCHFISGPRGAADVRNEGRKSAQPTNMRAVVAPLEG